MGRYNIFTNNKLMFRSKFVNIVFIFRNVSTIIKHVFIDCSTASPYISEMLNPGDTKVTEMKLKPWTLEMKELVLE